MPTEIPTQVPAEIPTEAPSPTPQILPTASNITPYSLPEGINPLTGLPPASPELLDRRPIASKIALYPRYVRTTNAGLSSSDIVFEYYIESGLTRFIAVFYGDNAKRIGPVRSGRFFDEHIARMYQSYLVFKYADKRVYDHLKSSDIYKFLIVPGNSYCPPFVIGKQELDTYNNIFLDATKFSDCLEKQEKDNSPPNLYTSYFSDLPPSAGEPALGIFTQYSLDDYHYWEYQPINQKYYRHQEANGLRDGESHAYAPLFDALSGEQVTADNVIFLFVPHTFYDQFQEEDEVYHIDLIGLGKAFLFRDGRVFPIYWRRVASNQPLLITDLNGMPIPLKPGRTFYQVLGINSDASNENNLWYFRFDTP
ncbi:MAG: DUF3048 domain-containing protein [Anaerolineae bacterium]|nr:DUF3048 domain-containing protein [Anaerolineae bacterium]MBT7073528.1 DUF3048 domain-containing protein [Anaerolineae bacterium]MBT7783260.1 DUF3048 domain-containing protein [Anaerolineae bacterium]